MRKHDRSRRGLAARSSWLFLGAILLAPGASLAISGVCPDGSIYIVQHESQIPCRASKRVEPSEMPPLRPDYLPTPYTWQVWNEGQDPNNPYNAIDAARQVRGLDRPQIQGQGANPAPPQPGAQRAALPPSSLGVGTPPAPQTVGPLDLGLTDQELGDLYTIISLSQERTPARIERATADGQGVFAVQLAHSLSFEARLRDAWASRGGLGAAPVLLFAAHSKRPEAFHANFTFVQGHLTFQPDRDNPRQLGVLQGRLGELEGGEVVLGYAVLPADWNVANELDVYWNDRHTAATFGR